MTDLENKKNEDCKTRAVARIKMMTALEEAIKALDTEEGVGTADLLRCVACKLNLPCYRVLPRFLDALQTAQKLGLLEKLPNNRYTSSQDKMIVYCTNCGGCKKTCQKAKKHAARRTSKCKPPRGNSVGRKNGTESKKRRRYKSSGRP